MSSPYAEIPTHNGSEIQSRFVFTKKYAIVSLVSLFVLAAVGVAAYYKDPIVSSSSFHDVIPSTEDLSDYFHRVVPAMPYTAPTTITHVTSSNECATKVGGLCFGPVNRKITRAVRQCSKKFDFGGYIGRAVADSCSCKAVGPAMLLSEQFIKSKGLCMCTFEKGGEEAYWQMALDCKPVTSARIII